MNKNYGVPVSVKMAEDHTETNRSQKTASTQTARESTLGLHQRAWKNAREAGRDKRNKSNAGIVVPTSDAACDGDNFGPGARSIGP